MEKKNRISDKKNLIFCLLMVAYPTIQFVVFYICVNLNSVLLAFKTYTPGIGYSWAGFSNFGHLWYKITQVPEVQYAFINSLKVYAITLCISLPLALLFSFYVYKKAFLSGFFRVILYIPSVISVLVICILFRYFIDEAIPELYNKLTGKNMVGLLANSKTEFAMLAFFFVWTAFGANVLMYTGAMSGIDDSIIESAQLDGVGFLREFFCFSIPLIWPTIVTFIVAGLAGLFMNQFNLYSFYGAGAEIYHGTVGYYIYKETLSSVSKYPEVATLGIVLSIIMTPITMVAKWMLEKFGPKVD